MAFGHYGIYFPHLKRKKVTNSRSVEKRYRAVVRQFGSNGDGSGASTGTVRNESEGFIRLVERCIQAQIADHRYAERKKRQEAPELAADGSAKPSTSKPLKIPKKTKRSWVQDEELFPDQFKRAVIDNVNTASWMTLEKVCYQTYLIYLVHHQNDATYNDMTLEHHAELEDTAENMLGQEIYRRTIYYPLLMRCGRLWRPLWSFTKLERENARHTVRSARDQEQEEGKAALTAVRYGVDDAKADQDANMLLHANPLERQKVKVATLSKSNLFGRVATKIVEKGGPLLNSREDEKDVIIESAKKTSHQNSAAKEAQLGAIHGQIESDLNGVVFAKGRSIDSSAAAKERRNFERTVAQEKAAAQVRKKDAALSAAETEMETKEEISVKAEADWKAAKVAHEESTRYLESRKATARIIREGLNLGTTSQATLDDALASTRRAHTAEFRRRGDMEARKVRLDRATRALEKARQKTQSMRAANKALEPNTILSRSTTRREQNINKSSTAASEANNTYVEAVATQTAAEESLTNSRADLSRAVKGLSDFKATGNVVEDNKLKATLRGAVTQKLAAARKAESLFAKATRATAVAKRRTEKLQSKLEDMKTYEDELIAASSVSSSSSSTSSSSSSPSSSSSLALRKDGSVSVTAVGLRSVIEKVFDSHKSNADQTEVVDEAMVNLISTLEKDIDLDYSDKKTFMSEVDAALKAKSPEYQISLSDDVMKQLSALRISTE